MGVGAIKPDLWSQNFPTGLKWSYGNFAFRSTLRLQEINVGSGQLPTEYLSTLRDLPRQWALWFNALAKYTANGSSERPQLSFHGCVADMEVKEIMASMQGCFQSLSLLALLKHRECLMAMGGIDSQVAVLAVQTLASSHEFMASCVNDKGRDASTMLQAFAALLQIAMTPDWCSSKFKPFPKVDENEIWPEIERFATHLLTKLRPSLVVLQFGNVTGKLQPEDYDENMKNILDSLEKALRMPCLTSLSQQWEVPNNSLDCSLVAALICDSGKLTSILQRSLLAPLQLQLLAGAPDRRRALMLLSQRFDFMMDSVLQGKYHGLKGNQGILQNIKLAVELRSGPVELDTVRHILYDVLGHCSCSQQANRDCDCPDPQFISWTVDVRDEFYSIWCWGNVFRGLAS